MPSPFSLSQPHRIRVLVRAAVLAVAVAALGAAAPVRAALRDWLPFGRTHDIARLLPAVVNIETISYKPDPQDKSALPRRVEAFGSGFIVDPAGYIVTNHHVIAGASSVHVTLQNGTSFPARIVGDAGFNIDLALLKVDAPTRLPVVKWGNSREVRVGDTVFVVGNPLAIGESVSAGIVSALNRNISETPYDDFIQTDAAINHGNSGGPMVNARGEVIGVATALYSPTDAGSIGLGFAIPSHDVEFVIDRLRKYHGLDFGYLGMRMQDVTADMANALGLSPPRGAIISSVIADAPASAAGIKVGDVVLTFDNQPFTDIRALGRMIATATIGDRVAISVWRDGHEQTLTATVGKWPQEMPAEASAKPVQAPPVGPNPTQLGLDLATLTDPGREKFKLAAGVNGVLVSGVMPGSTASDRGFAAGDVIVRVQDAAVTTPAEVQQDLVDALGHDHRFALLLVQTQKQVKWMALPISPASPHTAEAAQSAATPCSDQAFLGTCNAY